MAVDRDSLNHRHEEVPADYYDFGIAHNVFQAYWHWRRFRAIRSLLAGDAADTLLDLGCHGGYLTARLKLYTGASAVTAYDLSPSAIEHARRTHPGIRFEVADLHLGIPEPDRRFDLVSAFDVLEHLLDPAAFVREVRRVLKPGGRFIIAIPREHLLFKAVWWWWTKLGRGRVWHETHLHEFTPVSLVDLVERAGFRTVAERRIHLGMYRIVIYERTP